MQIVPKELPDNAQSSKEQGGEQQPDSHLEDKVEVCNYPSVSLSSPPAMLVHVNQFHKQCTVPCHCGHHAPDH